MNLYEVDKYTITTTVGELVKALQRLDQNAYVFTEGCDCTGNVVDVIMEPYGTAMICRDDNTHGHDLNADGSRGNYALKQHYKNRIREKK